MTAATIAQPLRDTDRPLYDRLCEITLDPSLPRGFKVLAGDAAWMEWPIEKPTDLSTEAIRKVLLDSYYRQKEAGKDETRECVNAFAQTVNNGCRFPKWCRGCYVASEAGEILHDSLSYGTASEYGDDLTIDVSRFQNADGTVDPASVQLAYTSGDVPEVPDVPLNVYISFTTVEARKQGEILMQATSRRRDQDHTPGVVLDAEFDDGGSLTVERLRARNPRKGRRIAESYGLTLREGKNGVPVKTVLDASNAWFLGRYLVIAANDGDGLNLPVPS